MTILEDIYSLQNRTSVTISYHLDCINNLLPIGLKGCVKELHFRPNSQNFDRVIGTSVLYPGEGDGIRVWFHAQVPYLYDDSELHDFLARRIFEIFMRLKG